MSKLQTELAKLNNSLACGLATGRALCEVVNLPGGQKRYVVRGTPVRRAKILMREAKSKVYAKILCGSKIIHHAEHKVQFRKVGKINLQGPMPSPFYEPIVKP